MPASQFRPDLKGLVLSSGKSLEAAKALASSLDAHFPTTAYNSFFDRNNETILNEFLKKLLLVDVAVLILGADDLLKEDKDGKEIYVPRDNVIFELGAVMARLGMKRVFVVMPKDPQVKKLSYLNSILPLNVPDDGDWTQVAAQIVDSLKKLDEDLFHSDLPALGLVQGYFFNFVKPVITTLTQPQCVRFEKSGSSEWDPGDGWTFTIIIPEKPMGRGDVDDLCKETLGTENVSVALNDGRDISVYALPRPGPNAPLHLLDVPTTLLTSRSAPSFRVKMPISSVPVTSPLAVMLSAPLPSLTARMPVLPPVTPYVVPAPVVTVRSLPLFRASMPLKLVPVTSPLAVMSSAPLPVLRALMP